MPKSKPIIQTETARHATVYDAIEAYITDRTATLNLHDSRLKTLEIERLEARSWYEKNDLTEKMMEHAKLDPRKYLIPFENHESPYFGIVGIHDTDKAIGQKEYILGKQSLINGTKVVIVDWRKAEVSRFFYEYEEADDYEEEINGRERIGIITHKRTVTIAQKTLLAIETATDQYQLTNGEWSTKDGNKASEPKSADIKTATGNHHLIDIVALIKPEQFVSITKNNAGCVYLTGGAGAGKTTVAQHRLSYLQFNHPDLFKPERCLFIVFNRTLKDYVKKSSKDLLGDTSVETYSAWAKTALTNLGCTNYKLTTDMSTFDYLKKHSEIATLLEKYISTKPKIKQTPIEDLFEFYKSSEVVMLINLLKHQFKYPSDETIDQYNNQHSIANGQTTTLSFADLGPLLRLCQLRNQQEEIPQAFNYYDHIIADEAQDFSQIELETIFAALNPRKSITICADPKQKILSFVDPSGLTNFQGKLHTVGFDKTTFTVGYRSAPEIMDVANAVAGKVPGIKTPQNTNIVQIKNVLSKDDAALAAIETIQRFQGQDPSSLTAIITKGRADLQFIHKALSDPTHGLKNIHPAGTIVFSPSIVIINAHQVKGLEFTNVILWNPSDTNYRNNDEDRNLLYVAISRACKRLGIIHWNKLSRCFGELFTNTDKNGAK